MSATVPHLPDDIDALRALVLEQRAELALARSGLVEQRYQIEALKARLARLLRASFGQSSEKLRSEIEQLELLLADQEEQAGETDTATEPKTATKDRNKPVRAPLPAGLSRAIIEHAHHAVRTAAARPVVASCIRSASMRPRSSTTSLVGSMSCVTCGPSSPAGPARQSCRRLHRSFRFTVAARVPGCSPTSRWRSIATTSRCIGKRNNTPARTST